MSYNLDPHPGRRDRIQILLAGLLTLLMWVLGMVKWASAQKLSSPATPAIITPPPGNRLFLVGRAVGTQGYICLPTGSGASWTVNSSRPEAILFAGAPGHVRQILSHFLSVNTNPNEFAPNPLPFASPTWQSSSDSSKVWGQTLHSIPSGSDASCPHDGAIGCLLLQSTGSATGPDGGAMMSRTTFIQRLNTQGGSAPGAGCSLASDVGKQYSCPTVPTTFSFVGKTNHFTQKAPDMNFFSASDNLAKRTT